MRLRVQLAALWISQGLLAAFPVEAAETRPLPTAEEVVRRVLARAEREKDSERAFDRLYDYTRTRIIEHRNGKNELKKREEQKSEHPPTTTLEKSNPAEGATATEGNTAKGDDEARGRHYQRRDFSMNDDLLDRFTFTLVGREIVNERPALIVAFQPANRKLAEHGLKDRFINRTAGQVWVDEADAVVVRAHLRLTDTVNIVGGLLGAVHGFTCELNRARTEEGLWFTRAMNWRLDARKLLVHETIAYAEERTNLRRARSDAGQPGESVHGSK